MSAPSYKPTDVLSVLQECSFMNQSLLTSITTRIAASSSLDADELRSLLDCYDVSPEEALAIKAELDKISNSVITAAMTVPAAMVRACRVRA